MYCELKLLFLKRLFVCILLSYCVKFLAAQNLSFYQSLQANGKLTLQVRNDSVKYVCLDMQVVNGNVEVCDSNPLIDYQFFIKRDVIESNWLNDILRPYEIFPDVSGSGSSKPWLSFEAPANYSYKEDYTDVSQKTGLTYKHHESRKNIVYYNIANPNHKVFLDSEKYHFQYDWDENIKGRFESFYPNGLKKFRHKYEINRIMSLDKNYEATKSKYNIDVQISGTIESYYDNGKKRAVVSYVDRYVVEKNEEEKEDKLTKASREGEKTSYYETGRVYSKGAFNKNGAHGVLNYYNKKGVLIKLETYKNGLLNGKYVEYFVDGTIKVKGAYALGAKSGVWQEFNPSGEKVSQNKY